MLISKYFDGLRQTIENCPVVSTKSLTLEERSDYTGIIRGTLCCMDNTVLHFTEVVDLEIRIDKVKYRYHYQEIETDERIFRYDNVKHHPSLPTFPHHKHCGPERDPDIVVASAEKSLTEILEEIENLLYEKNIFAS